MQIYAKRLDQEVFFKVYNNYLKLTKKCHALSHDAITTHVAVVFTRYMILAVENRISPIKKLLVNYFYLIADEMADLNYMQSFQILMDASLSTLTDKLSLTSSQLEQFIYSSLYTLPSSTKKCLVLNI